MKALQSKKLLIIITVVLLCAAVIVVIMAKKNSNETLTITDVDSGKEYAALTLPANREFSITFIHSVNKSPVTDVYIAKDDEIYLDRTLYYGFGAGVPTTISEGQHFAYGENGEMIISRSDLRGRYGFGSRACHRRGRDQSARSVRPQRQGSAGCSLTNFLSPA